MKQMNHTGSVNSKKAAAAKRLLKQKRMGLTLMLVSLALVGVLTGLGMEDATIAILLFPLGEAGTRAPGRCAGSSGILPTHRVGENAAPCPVWAFLEYA